MLVSEIISTIRMYLWNVWTDQITDADLLDYIKNNHKEAKLLAIQNSGSWCANWEEAEQDIVSWTRKYALPTDIISLKRIEINLTWDDEWWQVVYIDDIRNLDASENAWYCPNLCTIYDTYITLNSSPTANVTNWIKIFYSDESPELETTTDIAFPSVLIKYIIYLTCFDYSISRTLSDSIKKFQDLVDRYENKVKTHYTNRLPAVRPQLRARQQRFD